MPQSSLQQKLNFDANAWGNSGDIGIGSLICDFRGKLMRISSGPGVIISINEAKLLIEDRRSLGICSQLGLGEEPQAFKDWTMVR